MHTIHITLRDNILHCAITYYIARYTKRVALHCKPYSLHCSTHKARFALCNALYHFTTYRLCIVSHVTRRNNWEFPTIVQVDTSVLYNDLRDLHVSVKGSSVSSCQKLEKGNVFTEILTKGCSVERTGAKLRNCKDLRTIYIILCIKKNINIVGFCLCITLV